MAIQNPYEQYNKNKVMMASTAELTLMLYEGAIKFANIAVQAIENKDIEKAHKNIIKVQKIIEEFRATLDMKYPVAQDFERIYVYLLQRLVQANVKKDKAIVEEVLEHLRAMRDTWKQVMAANRGGGLSG